MRKRNPFPFVCSSCLRQLIERLDWTDDILYKVIPRSPQKYTCKMCSSHVNYVFIIHGEFIYDEGTKINFSMSLVII